MDMNAYEPCSLLDTLVAITKLPNLLFLGLQAWAGV